MEKIEKFYSKIERGLVLYVYGGMILVMAAYVCGNVIGRYCFRSPITGVYEIAALLIVPMTFLSASYGWRTEGTFVAAEFVLIRMKGKIRKVMVCFIQFCALFFYALLMAYGNLFGKNGLLWSYNYHEVSGAYGGFSIIVWPFKASVVLGLLIMSVRIVLEIIKLCRGREATKP